MRKFIALKTMGILMLLLSFGLVRGQSSSPTSQPKNAESALTPQEEAQILQNKEAWIASHPERYQQLTGQQVAPAEKEKQMTQQEKEAYYATHPELDTRQGAPTQMSSQPWGSPENKEAWIAAHPREYAEMTAAPTEVSTARQAPAHKITRSEFNALPVAKQQAIMNDPGFIIIETSQK